MLTLTIVSWVFIVLGVLSFLIVLVDIAMGRYQAMPIMNLSWPITCLYSSVIGLFMYFKYGRAPAAAHHCHEHMHMDMSKSKTAKKNDKAAPKKPFWVQIYISSTHCGAGCGVADIISENLVFFAGITFFGYAIYASFFIDYAFALLFGLAFQYYNIKPMRPELSVGQALWESLKADVLSLTSFQVGMYAWMLAFFFMFTPVLTAGSVVFWFMMQIGMTIGLFSTYPVNWLLIKTGIKVPCAH